MMQSTERYLVGLISGVQILQCEATVNDSSNLNPMRERTWA